METLLKELSIKINIELRKDEISKFILYKDLLQKWNKKINLTAITEDNEIIIKHFMLRVSYYFLHIFLRCSPEA